MRQMRRELKEDGKKSRRYSSGFGKMKAAPNRESGTEEGSTLILLGSRIGMLDGRSKKNGERFAFSSL